MAWDREAGKSSSETQFMSIFVVEQFPTLQEGKLRPHELRSHQKCIFPPGWGQTAPMHESETWFAPCSNMFTLVLTSSPTLKKVLVSGLKQNTRPKKCVFGSARGEEMGHAPFSLHPSRIGHDCSDTAVLKETAQQFVEPWGNSEGEVLGSAVEQSVTEGLSNVHPHNISNGKILDATRDGLSRT